MKWLWFVSTVHVACKIPYTFFLRSIYSFEQLLLEISPQRWFYFLFALLSSSITVKPSVTSCTVVSLFQFSGLKRKVRIYGLNNIDQRVFFFYIPSRHDFALRKQSLSLMCTVYIYNTCAYRQTSGPSE